MLKFAKWGVVALACLPFAGCAELSQLSAPAITPQQIIVGANAFDALEVTATNYLRLPLCPAAKICRTAAGVKAIVPAIRAARNARNALEKDIAANSANGALVPVTDYQALETAVSTLESLLTQFGG